MSASFEKSEDLVSGLRLTKNPVAFLATGLGNLSTVGCNLVISRFLRSQIDFYLYEV